jgi:putative heme-binding domain-containing protein
VEIAGVTRILRCCSLLFLAGFGLEAAPVFLDQQFELPSGFRIYRAANAELSGGSYDLAFDGQGRLLVGDGNAVRRLIDGDGDGVFDSFEVIATGLGWRGPQGLLVWGDRLYAVGGDGIQLFEGYGSASGLVHKGRVGRPFRTGGDHEGHTILRGHDGYLYFMSGDGGGVSNRFHITESTSPVLFERAASVFRISPDGEHWECVSAGGRNPPNLGQNYLGELFSFDSDMEWHVGLPWWRPVRLNHWLVGGDQGWQEVGAYPPYFIDCLPGILDVGRGSPTWGVFYEHTQFPSRYENSFLVCDYRWKRESDDQYATSGRLLAFFLKQEGAGWKATMETLARPKPDARDSAGKPISFALVDVEVAPDGSIFLSDHNQGIWRIVYGNHREPFSIMPPLSGASPLEKLLKLPQPASEWSRLAEEELKTQLGDSNQRLQTAVLDSKRHHQERLRALRLLALDFDWLPDSFLASLAQDPNAELRGQAAWLAGLRGSVSAVWPLLSDTNAFVRRRMAEALTRVVDANTEIGDLVPLLDDPDRLVRYGAMCALAHQTNEWIGGSIAWRHPQIRMRALVATKLRRQLPPVKQIRSLIAGLLTEPSLTREDHLDLLRVVGIFREQLSESESVRQFLAARFSSDDQDISFEQVRLAGEYRVSQLFPKLLVLLEKEPDHVRQFHIAQAISKLDGGWNDDQEHRLLAWFLKQQRGWFAEFSGKGVEFPQFWATVLADFGQQHRAAFLNAASQIDLAGLLGSVYIDLLAARPNGPAALITLHSKSPQPKIVRRLAQFTGAPSSEHREIVANAFMANADPEVAKASAEFLARHPHPESRQQTAEAALRYMEQHRSLFQPMAKLLSHLSGTNFPVKTVDGKVDSVAREQAVASWRALFGVSAAAPQLAERSDEEIYRLILKRELNAGHAARGGQIYERLQCHTCHGGGVNPGREGRIFGPDLAGVTRRLSRQEFADSLVYPSKQVPDRFKACELTLKDGNVLTGFITEQNDQAVTFVERDQVRQLARRDISSITPQKTSLMPEKLLNRVSDQDLADLLAFLEK